MRVFDQSTPLVTVCIVLCLAVLGVLLGCSAAGNSDRQRRRHTSQPLANLSWFVSQGIVPLFVGVNMTGYSCRFQAWRAAPRSAMRSDHGQAGGYLWSGGSPHFRSRSCRPPSGLANQPFVDVLTRVTFAS